MEVLRLLYNRFLGTNDATIEQLQNVATAQELVTRISQQNDQLQRLVSDHDAKLLAHLNYNSSGKTIDSKYEAYLIKQCDDYFEKNGITDPEDKLNYAERVLPRHRDYRLTHEPLFMISDNIVCRTNYINQLLGGSRISFPWTNFFRPTICTLESENTVPHYPVPESISWSKLALIGIGAAIIGYVGYSTISRLSQIQHHTSIIHQTGIQQLQHIANDINRRTLTLTIPRWLDVTYTVTLNVMSVMYTRGRELIMWIVSLFRQKEINIYVYYPNSDEPIVFRQV